MVNGLLNGFPWSSGSQNKWMVYKGKSRSRNGWWLGVALFQVTTMWWLSFFKELCATWSGAVLWMPHFHVDSGFYMVGHLWSRLCVLGPGESCPTAYLQGWTFVLEGPNPVSFSDFGFQTFVDKHRGPPDITDLLKGPSKVQQQIPIDSPYCRSEWRIDLLVWKGIHQWNKHPL